MNSAFVGSASVDNFPLDLLNSSYPTQSHSVIANYTIIVTTAVLQ